MCQSDERSGSPPFPVAALRFQTLRGTATVMGGRVDCLQMQNLFMASLKIILKHIEFLRFRYYYTLEM